MTLFRRILSFNISFNPLNCFHFGEVIFPLYASDMCLNSLVNDLGDDRQGNGVMERQIQMVGIECEGKKQGMGGSKVITNQKTITKINSKIIAINHNS